MDRGRGGYRGRGRARGRAGRDRTPPRYPSPNGRGRGRSVRGTSPPRQPGARVTNVPEVPRNSTAQGEWLGARPKVFAENYKYGRRSDLGERSRDRGEYQHRGQRNREYQNRGERNAHTQYRGNQGQRSTAITTASPEPLRLVANYVPITFHGEGSIFRHYRVDFSPPVERLNWRSNIISQFLNQKLPKKSYIYHGDEVRSLVDIEMPLEWTDRHPITNKPVQVVMKRTGECSRDSDTGLKVINVLLKKAQRRIGLLTLNPKEGSCYDLMYPIYQIAEYDMNVYGGFKMTVDSYGNEDDHRPLLNIDVDSRVLKSKNVWEDICDIRRKFGGNDTDRFRQEVDDYLGHADVFLRHSQKTQRVREVLYDETVNTSFEGNEGRITFVEYYQMKYGVELEDPDSQILLLYRQKIRDPNGVKFRNEKVPAQLCFRLGLSKELRNDVRAKRQMQRVTRKDPTARVKEYLRFIEKIHSNDDCKAIFETWEMKFGESLVQVDGEVINHPIFYFCGGMEKKVEDANWTRLLKGEGLLTRAAPAENCLYFIYPEQMSALVQQFESEFLRCVKNQRLEREFGRVHHITLSDPRPNEYKNALRNIYRNVRTFSVTFIGRRNQEILYSQIKKELWTGERPAMNQCITEQLLWQGSTNPGLLSSAAIKIVWQMQAKLAAKLWAVKIPPKCNTSVMCIGIDVFRDKAQSKSVVGFVNTLDSSFVTVHTSTAQLEKKQEILKNGPVLTKMALEAYHCQNGNLPETIIVFRDGVGDGQLEDLKAEIVQMEQACQMLGAQAQIIFIVVQKRINTRLMIENNRGSYINPSPGTLVDSTITRPQWKDFFLVSQSVNQGTATPTHYNVIRNDAKWKCTDIQRFTYAMTHLYANWTGTIRVPAVVQYAHRAAYQHGTVLDGAEASRELACYPYYL